MIRLPAPDLPLDPAERYGLELLVDLARVVPVTDPHPGADVVRVELVETAATRSTAVGDWRFDVADGVVRISRSTLLLVTDLAGAAVEQRSSERDRYERVPSAANPLVALGQERRPVVSQAAATFRAAVRKAAGRRPVVVLAPWPQGKRWAVGLSHDLDVVQAWPAFTALRIIELLRRFALGQVVRVKLSALASIGRDPIGAGVRSTLESEPTGRVASTWFILCGSPTWATIRAGDLTYVPEATATRRVLAVVQAAGAELGLHGSFETLHRHEAFGEQRERLTRLTGKELTGIRQHYVRMRPGVTQRGMAAAGFTYDSTYGFPDRNGFRLGVADVVPAWDDDRGRTLPIDEVPLTWMERALSKYAGIEDPEAWVADALDLAAAARAVEGLWVGVWHPNTTPALGFPGAVEAYRRLVQELLADDPFVAPLGTIAAWRRARRDTRIRAVAEDGRADLTAPLGPFPVERDGA